MWGARRWGGVTVSGFNLTGTPALIVIALTAIQFRFVERKVNY